MSPVRHAVRLGIESVRNVGDDLAERIAERRPYASMEDLVRRTGAPLPAVEALATAGAFGCFDDSTAGRRCGRRGRWPRPRPDRLPGVVVRHRLARRCPPLTEPEVTAADLWSTGISADRHPVQFARPRLDEHGRGHRRRPGRRPPRTAGGGGRPGHPPPAPGHRRRASIFVNLEDETGMLNVICNAAGVGRLPPGGPDVARPARPGPPGAGRGRHQPHRRDASRPCRWRSESTRSRDFR